MKTGESLYFAGCLFCIDPAREERWENSTLSATAPHTQARCHKYYMLCLKAGGIALIFTLAMLLKRNMHLNIAVTVLFVFAIFLLICRYGRRIELSESEASNDSERGGGNV